MRDAGAPVALVEAVPDAGLVVCYADDIDRLRCHGSKDRRIVVSVRADRRPNNLADFEVVQNPSSASRYSVFIPSWLQPGLIPRDRTRGTRVETLAFLGARQQIHDDLLNLAWQHALDARQLRWDARIATFVGNDALYSDLRWNDYSEIDVIVALRPETLWPSPSKPAAKLQNAWAAGVPAILSPELAYQQMRRSPLDFLDAENATSALDAVDRLRKDSDLYDAIVKNGLERAQEFQTERLTERWAHLLWHQLPVLAASRQHQLHRRTRRLHNWRPG